MNIVTSLYYLAVKINANDVGVPKVGADQVLSGILTTIYFVAGIAAVIVIIMGGIFYAISGGDPSKVKYAKDSIMYAIVGLVVVATAFLITNIVIGSF